MTVPTREEINVYHSLDEQAPWCMDFLGKTIDEAAALFESSSLYYQEGLMWMGPVAFRYYVRAAIRYIQGESSTADDGFISCFAMVLEHRLKFEPTELIPVAKELGAACAYILANHNRFDLDCAAYKDVQPRVEKLRQALLRLSNQHQAL